LAGRLLADFLAVRPLVVFLPVDFLAAAALFDVDFLALEPLLLDFFAADFRGLELPLLLDFFAADFRGLELPLLLDFLAADFLVLEPLLLDFLAADFLAVLPDEPSPLEDDFLAVDLRDLLLPEDRRLLEDDFLREEPSSDDSEFLSSSWPSSSLLTTSLSRISPRQPSCSSCSSNVCIVISRRN
jgi:hypothetical protein